MALALVLSTLAPLPGCAARPLCNGAACAPACPRSATRDAAGRCDCSDGDALVLGACVSPAVGDAYCGPAARLEPDGCAYRSCASDEALDAVTGVCTAKSSVTAAGSGTCPDGSAPAVAQRRMACLDASATCPRGTQRTQGRNGAEGADGADGADGANGADEANGANETKCVRPPRCPAGSLPAGGGCRAVVTVGARAGSTRVDLGAWTSLVLGPDGGPGSPDLCRPLALRPEVFGVVPGDAETVRLAITLVVPDQDLTRVHAEARAALWTEKSSRPVSPDGDAVVAASLGPLLEPLRGLGGEASTAILEVRVSCKVKSF